jgi:6-phosphogluconolactonase
MRFWADAGFGKTQAVFHPMERDAMGKRRFELPPHVKIEADVQSLYRRAATEFTKAANDAVGEKDLFTVALSGGSTPRGLYSLLATDPAFRNQIPWEKCFFFWSDERLVPPEHADSNFRMANDALLKQVPVKCSQIFRISGENDDPTAAAAEYGQILSGFFQLKPGEFPRFDLVLLGMGSDGHTASLFPGTAALDEQQRVAAVNWVGKLNSHRITLTSPVLNNAARILFLVSGEEKAPALKAVLEGPKVPIQLPAQLVQPRWGSLAWLVDKQAGSLLKPTN